LNVKPPLRERKAPRTNVKSPLLTTFWRRFWVKFLDILLTGTGHRDRRLNRDVW